MFSAIGRFDVRFRYLIVALWIIAIPVAVEFLPSLAGVSQSSSSQVLSATAPTVQATTLARAFFGGKNPASIAVLVAVHGQGPLTAADDAAISRAEKGIARIPGVSIVRDAGTSTDGKAREAVVIASSSALSDQARTIVNDTRAELTAVHAPAGLAFHLTGQLAEGVDATNSVKSGSIAKFTVLFIIVLLIVVYRALLAPLVTLIPAGCSLVIAGALVAEASKFGLSVTSITQELLVVLLLGAGTDYGLFLVFRVREECGRGLPPDEAVVLALGRVGETISYSALTVAGALLTLMLASFGIFRGLGPALAIGLIVLLIASLTLTPALIAIFGKVLFWPSHPDQKPHAPRIWRRLAELVIRRPAITLIGSLMIFGALAAGLTGYRTAGFSNGAPAGSDSAAGESAVSAHFSVATAGSDELILHFGKSVWDDLPMVARAERQLGLAPVFGSVSGPLDPNGTRLSTTELHHLGYTLGPPILLTATQATGHGHVPSAVYAAYRSIAQYISPDGHTIQFYATMRAGPPGSTAAAAAVPAARSELAAVARAAGASAHGALGQDTAAYDIGQAASSSLLKVVPVVLFVLLALLALLLRSLVAPWYLVITVGLSYLASLGAAMIVFVHLGGDSGLNFVLPFLMFVFAMALGEDYNILVTSRIREEIAASRTRGVTGQDPAFREALTRAVAITGGTVTSAGIILAGTFTVLGVVGGNAQAQEIGFGIAFGVFLDTFLVRTLLIPSIAALLGRWNWWPSALSAPERTAGAAGAAGAVVITGPAEKINQPTYSRGSQQ